VRAIRLTCRRAESDPILYVADLRVLGADPMSALSRPAAQDKLVKKDGQVFQGALLNDLYAVTTPLGQFIVPAERVVGLQSVGQGTVRLVLTDAQVLCGLLTSREIRLADADGTVHEVNIRDVASLAYRLSAARPEQCEPASPMLVVGESRLAFESDKLSLTLKTPHGSMDLPPGVLLSLEKDANGSADGPPQFRARSRCGSLLTGTLAGDMFEVHLAAGKTCAIEARQLVRINWPGRVHEPAGSTVIALRDGRRVVGRITSDSLTVNTGFGSESIGWPNIQTLTTGRVDPTQATLKVWGRDAVEGRITDNTINFALAEGPTLRLQTAAVAAVKGPKSTAAETPVP
jgi:hypothetical protein